MTNWSGQGTKITQIEEPTFMSAIGAEYDIGGSSTDSYVAIPTDKSYILNKLTTVTMQSDAGGSQAFYNIALTGGTITIANNISYVTPSTLAEVDTPVGSFTGSFSVSGNMDSYLRGGIGLADGSDIDNAYGSEDLLRLMSENREVINASNIIFEMGGRTNASKVLVTLPNAQIGVPAMSVDSIVSQSLEFKGIPSSSDMNDGDEVNLEFFQ